MKASVVDKKSGEVVYSVEVLGNPFKPDSVAISGTKKSEYQERMKLWYDSGSEFTREMVNDIKSKVDYHMTLIYNVVDENKYDVIIEDYPDHTKYPEYVAHVPRQHGGAFEFEVF